MARLTNMQRLERVVADLPEAERVDIEAWDDHPSFRVRNKNFVFSNTAGTSLGFKLPKDEAVAVVASDPSVTPMGYGLGRHGWVSLELESRPAPTAGPRSRSGSGPATRSSRPSASPPRSGLPTASKAEGPVPARRQAHTRADGHGANGPAVHSVATLRARTCPPL